MEKLACNRDRCRAKTVSGAQRAVPVLAISIVCSAAMFSASTGAAQRVEDAAAAFDEADFEGASLLLDRVEARTDLTREELIRLLRLRVMIVSAQRGPSEEIDRALRAWCSVSGTTDLGVGVPVRLRTRITALASECTSPEVRVLAQRERDEVTMVATHVAVDGLTRAVRVFARVGAAGSWVEGAHRLTMEAADSDAVFYYAQLLGPGGVIIAEAGTAISPVVLPAPPVPPEEAVLTLTTLSRTDESTPTTPGQEAADDWWIAIGVAGGVLAVVTGVVVGIVVATQPSDDITIVRGPAL